MLMGIFKKSSIKRVYPDGDSSVNLSTTLVKDNVVTGGSSVTFVRRQTVDVRNLPDSLPTKEEFDLEEQLKAGIRPEAINVSGILGSDDSFDVNQALNTIYKDSKDSEVNDVSSTEASE